ncbi:hypothetical protein QBC34DRAFT_141737 [Podospora aff. communis PSN243]|uniref:Uncharacterized protein n=1 Tax=Podospora aff. communis PSN243 TaxID=3040156 RepID=A0AAV9H204_9PEZI|nr:hypothetical protein QBC34DRAFT_141737 [Podospora aff. communis PSN243]
MTTTAQRLSARPDEDLPMAVRTDGPEKVGPGPGPVANSELEVDVRRRPEEGSAPQHPITSMQDAFAESLFEATQGGQISKPKLRSGDAKARREELLDQEKSAPPPVASWRYRPGQVNHELRRLMAQISFGVYLLLNGMANSQVLVVSILQGHIDEVDEYLETTLEDIGLATKDLRDRISHLKLPMDNMVVFEQMLEDHKFRMQILDGNEKIEHIVARTQIALQQTVQDLAEGVSATREFSIYLAEQENGLWRRDRPDVIDIFDAMKGNTDGWFNAFIDLQAKASTLNSMIVQLNGMVAEMDRKAAEVSRRTQHFATEPEPSPRSSLRSSLRSSTHHSPRNSDASASTVIPASPVLKIPSAPPRLSLRLSTISAMEADTTFFGIRTARQSIIQLRTEPLKSEPPTIESPMLEESVEEVSEHSIPLQVAVEEPEPESGIEQDQSGAQNAEEVVLVETPQSPPPPARNPRRISVRPPPVVVPPPEDKNDEDDAMYILQPRTYTPVPPSPLPSPRVHDYPPRVMTEQPKLRVESIKPVRIESMKPVRVETLSGAAKTPAQQGEPQSPRLEQRQLRTQSSRPKLVAIGARGESRASRVEPRPEVPRVSESRGVESHRKLETPRVAEAPHIPEAPLRRSPEVPQVQEARRVPDSDLEVLPKQRTSLRQRVSLKTTPPESIQIPPPNAPELHRPIYNQSPRVYQAPDSAYGSDMERPPVNSMVSIECSLAEFPTPPPRPIMVPSPHSDQQFFRPVQASPHSPLQQRPHTSGTMSARAPHNQPPPRNIPSAMGMSMLSNVTTMSHQSISSQTLKKKRSAFRWLKKAFSLDEEERAAFEQKKREQQRNLYYDERSPKFIDGKRVQPRQQAPSYYAESYRS